MTDDDKALVERLRDDWPEILVEKHWMMDSDAIEEQRKEAADRIEAQAAEIAELKSWKAAEEAHHHKLRAEIERLIQAGDGDVGLIHWQGEEIERLREALRPFAKAGEIAGEPSPYGDWYAYRPAAGDEYAIFGQHLREARAALGESHD